jgi:hypothetical protein
MKTPLSLLPDSSTLTARLSAALDHQRDAGGPVRVISRNLPRFMSTFPNEIVTCQWPGGRRRRVFVKYQAGVSHDSFGHRGDLPYEAEVYRRLLKALPDFRPRFLGAHNDPETGDTSLFLEYAYRNIRLSDISWKRSIRQPMMMARTAHWLARFHATQEPKADDASLRFLKRYDAGYYCGWAERTFGFAQPLLSRFPWLKDLQACGDAWFRPLQRAAPTVIHGEFYAKTVLVRGEDLFMVDWESAAIAAGEIDLATLTDGRSWPADLVRQCVAEYRDTRWPERCPAEFERTLAAARMYLNFRWLGERPDWTLREKTLWRFDHLRAAAARLDLV